MPPSGFIWEGFMCFLIILTFSTTTRSFAGIVLRTVPSLPLSLPLITTTLSPVLTCMGIAPPYLNVYYSTSGASETIFMKLPSRSSRATGPKIRVPLGPLSSRMITHAFSSNLMYEPSSRRTPDLVLTITALTISPFLTTPPRSEEHTSELQSRGHLVCRLLLEKKKHKQSLSV